MFHAADLHTDVSAAPTVQDGVRVLLKGIVGQLRDRHSDPDQVLIYCSRLDQAIDALADAVAVTPEDKPAKHRGARVGAKAAPDAEGKTEAKDGEAATK